MKLTVTELISQISKTNPDGSYLGNRLEKMFIKIGVFFLYSLRINRFKCRIHEIQGFER